MRSPLTGAVVTWNVRQLLEARPVQKGQALMQVADLTGPWVLEIEVPDDRIGHVLEDVLGDHQVARGVRERQALDVLAQYAGRREPAGFYLVRGGRLASTGSLVCST